MSCEILATYSVSGPQDHALCYIPTGIPEISREAVFFATFRAADDREFLVGIANPDSSPRPVRTHARQDGGAHGYS